MGRNFPDSVQAQIAVICLLSSTAAISTLFMPFLSIVHWHERTILVAVLSQFMTRLGGISFISTSSMDVD